MDQANGPERARDRSSTDDDIITMSRSVPGNCVSGVMDRISDIRARVWARVGDHVGYRIWGVEDRVRDRIKSSILDHVRAQVRERVPHIGAQVWVRVGVRVRNHVNAVQTSIRDYIWS